MQVEEEHWLDVPETELVSVSDPVEVTVYKTVTVALKGHMVVDVHNDGEVGSNDPTDHFPMTSIFVDGVDYDDDIVVKLEDGTEVYADSLAAVEGMAERVATMKALVR